MRQVLVIGADELSGVRIQQLLEPAGYRVAKASLMRSALAVLKESEINLIISEMRLADGTGPQLLRHLATRRRKVAVILIVSGCTTTEIVEAMRLGAATVLDLSDIRTRLLAAVDDALAPGAPRRESSSSSVASQSVELHAVKRWAQIISALLASNRDTRTTEAWSHVAFVSTGTIRGWCAAAGISPRHSLVFGRLLRAVILMSHGGQRLENLLDIVDQRTQASLLKMTGFHPSHGLPVSPDEFLDRQTLVRDPLLAEVRRLVTLGRPGIQAGAARR